MNEIAGPGGRRESSPPSPSTDRAALSEAWYRALYGTQPAARAPHAVPAVTQSRSAGAAATARPATASGPAAGRGPRAAPANSVSAERDTPALESGSRLQLKRRPLAQLAPVRACGTETARRTAYRVALPEGTVELLVQQRGRRLHVVALSAGAAGSRVAAALQRARAALAAHGLRLDIGQGETT